MDKDLPPYENPAQVTMNSDTMDVPRRGNWKALKSTGIIHIVLGALTIILGIVTIVIEPVRYYYGAPIWCGLLFYVTAGILGVVSGGRQNSRVAVGYMVMSILACLAAFTVIVFSACILSLNAGWYGFYDHLGFRITAATADSLLIVLGLIEFVVSIVSAALTCGCTTPPTQTAVDLQPGRMGAPAGTQHQPGNWKGLWTSGIVQIELGAVTAILGAVSIAYIHNPYHVYAASPVWGGILFYIVAGILGILSGVRKDSCSATAYMVMSILSCIATCFVVGFSGAAIAYCRFCFPRITQLAIDGSLIVLAVAEFVVAIIGASLTCSAVCKPAPNPTVVYYHQAHPQVIVAGQPKDVVSKPALQS